MFTTIIQQPGGVLATPRNNQIKLKQAVFVVGGPNAGKGNVSEFLTPHGRGYSSSRSLKGYANRHNRKDVLHAMDRGDLVQYEVVELVSTWDYNDALVHQEKAFLDGWWRIEKEPQTVIPIFLKAGVDVQVIALDAEEGCLEERATGRGREDAVRSVFRNRFNIHKTHFGSVLRTSKSLLGNERVHLIDTTHLSKGDVREKVAALLPNFVC